jgi:hypothetical protein
MGRKHMILGMFSVPAGYQRRKETSMRHEAKEDKHGVRILMVLTILMLTLTNLSHANREPMGGYKP